jgi:capsular exopolysaccharide synthesis family protein
VDLQDLPHVFRRRWRLVCLTLLVCLGLAGLFTVTRTKIYQATTQVFVSLRGGTSTSNSAYQDTLFSQQRVKSYVKIANSPSVTQPVVDRLRSRLTARQLAARITASAPADTVLINISVRGPDPAQARDLANAVAARFSTVVAELESPGPGRPSPVTVTVVRPAEQPGGPISPRPALNLGLALVAGLALGVGLAVLREALDTSVKTSADLQELTGAFPLGLIGFDPTAARSPLVSQVDPRAIRLEAFRTLRTNLRFVDVDRPARVVVLTSSVAGEGKSTTACNLAVTLACAGARVVLVEGDLRRPQVAEYMGLEGAAGLTDVLIGRSHLEDVLQPWGNLPLSVLTSGPLPPNPAEMLGSVQMADLIASLRARAEMVIIDAPPLLPVTDAAVLARECDGALLIVRQGHTTREQLTRSMEAMRGVGARILGTVLNMVPASGHRGYGYDYYAGYASSPDRPRLDSDPRDVVRR